jgi:hypothetical protein
MDKLEALVARKRKERSLLNGATEEFANSSEEKASPEADRLVADWRAFEEQLIQKYGKAPGELPFDEWVIDKNLRARVARLTVEERRYICRRLWSGLPLRYAKVLVS